MNNVLCDRYDRKILKKALLKFKKNLLMVNE